MMTPILMALLLAPQPHRTAVGAADLRNDEPPVRLWLSGNRRFEPGDRARIQVEARDDGYLLVLHYDTDGLLRLLFPVEPGDDGFVRGGRRYEVRGDRERESFVAGPDGSGFVYVALAPDPWRVRDWVRGGRWDYDRIALDPETTDPERDLTGLLETVSSERGFDYDLIEYFVNDVEVVRYEYRPTYFTGPGVFAGDPWCDPWWSNGWYCGRTGIAISYGRYYSGDWWSIGYGPSWYWPWAYDYRYRPYGYGRGAYIYRHYRPWVVTGGTYRPGFNQPIVVGRSRDYDIVRRSPWTFGDAGVSGRPAAPAPSDEYRARPRTDRARPVAPDAGRPSTEAGRPAARPADRGRSPATGSARPAAGRPSPERSPSAGRAPAPSPAPAPARARPRAGRGGEDEAAEVRSVPAARTPATVERSRQASGASRSTPVEAQRSAPVERRPARTPAARNAPTPAARPAPPPAPAARSATSNGTTRSAERPASNDRSRGRQRG